MADSQCARCGSSADWDECTTCGGEGETEPGALYDLDPCWYDPDDTEPCSVCFGAGGWWTCLSGAAWCEAHPLPGREKVQRGTVERFETKEPRHG